MEEATTERFKYHRTNFIVPLIAKEVSDFLIHPWPTHLFLTFLVQVQTVCLLLNTGLACNGQIPLPYSIKTFPSSSKSSLVKNTNISFPCSVKDFINQQGVKCYRICVLARCYRQSHKFITIGHKETAIELFF